MYGIHHYPLFDSPERSHRCPVLLVGHKVEQHSTRTVHHLTAPRVQHCHHQLCDCRERGGGGEKCQASRVNPTHSEVVLMLSRWNWEREGGRERGGSRLKAKLQNCSRGVWGADYQSITGSCLPCLDHSGFQSRRWEAVTHTQTNHKHYSGGSLDTLGTEESVPD